MGARSSRAGNNKWGKYPVATKSQDTDNIAEQDSRRRPRWMYDSTAMPPERVRRNIGQSGHRHKQRWCDP